MNEIYRETIATGEDRCAESIKNTLLKKIIKENEIKKPELDPNTDFLNNPEVTLVPKIINKPSHLPPIPFLQKQFNKPSVQSKLVVESEHNISTLNQSSIPKFPLPKLPVLPILPSQFFPPNQSSEFPINPP
jgi:hypothetical protein